MSQPESSGTDVSPPMRQARRCRFAPPEQYEQLRDRGELGRIRLRAGGEAWLVTRYDHVTAVLSDARFSSAVNAAPPLPDGAPTPAWFFGMDAAEHIRYRKILAGRFTLRAARALAPRIARVVDDRLTRLRAAGPVVDLVEQYSWPVPKLVMDDLLGLDPAGAAAFDAAMTALDAAEQGTDEQFSTAYADVWREALRLAGDKRANPHGGLLADLQARSQLTVAEAASVAVSLRMAGHAPVAHVLGLGLFLLLSEPRLRAPLTDPARSVAAVDELLRYLPTNNLGVVRVSTGDTTLAGAVVREGSLVYVSVPTANRDPRQFVDAEHFDPHRPATSHLAFGYGPHKCLGQNLAKVVLELAIRRLLDRFPELRLAVDPDEIPMINTPTSYGVAYLAARL